MTEKIAHEELTTVLDVEGKPALVRKAEVERIQQEEAENDIEPVEYELIFSKYPTLDSLAFKQKLIEDYNNWQRDMLRLYTDSHLAATSAMPEAEVYCVDHSFNIKKKGKGKLKATFIIKEGKEEVGRHRLVLNKVKVSDIHPIIDGHMYLLEMALKGNKEDFRNEDGNLHKFCNTIQRPQLLATTLELLNAIEEMKIDGTIIEKEGK